VPATAARTEAGVPEISAHQGGGEAAALATFDAYKHALGSGAEYAEFDIRKTADGVLVAYHDARAGHDGPPVASLGYPALCDQLGYVVPRIDELMSLLAGRLRGHLDLKETGYEHEVVSLARSAFGPGNFLVTSLEDSSLQVIKRDFPLVRTALSLGRGLKHIPCRRWAAIRASELRPGRRLRRCGADAATVNYQLGRYGVISACHRGGLGVMVWTVDSDELIDRYLLDRRIELLITNRPQYAARRRAELEAR
jgi:glycerophosphoryl diester phosphodiesterase